MMALRPTPLTLTPRGGIRTPQVRKGEPPEDWRNRVMAALFTWSKSPVEFTYEYSVMHLCWILKFTVDDEYVGIATDEPWLELGLRGRKWLTDAVRRASLHLEHRHGAGIAVE